MNGLKHLSGYKYWIFLLHRVYLKPEVLRIVCNNNYEEADKNCLAGSAILRRVLSCLERGLR